MRHCLVQCPKDKLAELHEKFSAVSFRKRIEADLQVDFPLLVPMYFRKLDQLEVSETLNPSENFEAMNKSVRRVLNLLHELELSALGKDILLEADTGHYNET